MSECSRAGPTFGSSPRDSHFVLYCIVTVSDDLSRLIQEMRKCLATDEGPPQEEKIENIRELMSIWADNQSVSIKAVPNREQSLYSTGSEGNSAAKSGLDTSQDGSLDLSEDSAHSSTGYYWCFNVNFKLLTLDSMYIYLFFYLSKITFSL